MIFFKNSSDYFGKPSLTIVKYDDDQLEDGITFLTYDPVVGDLAASWSPMVHPRHLSSWCTEYTKSVTLRSSIHDPASLAEFPLLLHRIQRDEISWGSSSSFIDENSFLSGYWEWLEDVLSRCNQALRQADIYKVVYASLFTYDCNPRVLRAFCELWCPLTNTLHTSVGELSLSLWDLRKLGGLPIRGLLYDEVVPSAEQLLDLNDNPERLPLRSCKFLFGAFAEICTKTDVGYQVTMSSWVNFWFRRTPTYKPPPTRVYRKHTTCPVGEGYNPTGEINAHFERSWRDEAPFLALGISDDIKDEVYLAAFLSCWLCKFVLPNKNGNIIRPSVFKVASLMAYGRGVSLAIPVLANIYNGLREISTSVNLKKCTASLPIHYVYSWLGEYFHTHHSKERSQDAIVLMAAYAGEKMAKYFSQSDAQELFHNISRTSLQSLAWCDKTKRTLVDTSSLSWNSSEYFISNRSSYLTMRRNDEHIVESYSLHRFGIQFGFCQDLPGDLKKNLLSVTLQGVYQWWESCTRFGTQSKLIVPPSPIKGATLTTRRYDKWWSGIWSKLFPTTGQIPIKSVIVDLKPSKLKKIVLNKNKGNPAPAQQLNVIEGANVCRGATSSDRTRSNTPVYQPFTKPRLLADGHEEAPNFKSQRQTVNLETKSSKKRLTTQPSGLTPNNVTIIQVADDDINDDYDWKHKKNQV